MKCSKCFTPIPVNGLFCPQCGERVQVNVPPRSSVVPSVTPAPTLSPTMLLVPTPDFTAREMKRQKRREKRRRARGFWYSPLTNFICLVLCVAGWFFIPYEITVYVSNYDFSQLLANAAKLFGFFSGRDIAAATTDALIAIGLIVVLILVSILGLTAIYRIFKRLVVFSRSKKEWKKQQNREIEEISRTKEGEGVK